MCGLAGMHISAVVICQIPYSQKEQLHPSVSDIASLSSSVCVTSTFRRDSSVKHCNRELHVLIFFMGLQGQSKNERRVKMLKAWFCEQTGVEV